VSAIIGLPEDAARTKSNPNGGVIASIHDAPRRTPYQQWLEVEGRACMQGLERQFDEDMQYATAPSRRKPSPLQGNRRLHSIDNVEHGPTRFR
jgi:hypothetical protein